MWTIAFGVFWGIVLFSAAITFLALIFFLFRLLIGT